MVRINWNKISKEDIIKAIKVFVSENHDILNPKGLWLLYKGQKYPAKYIRKLAYNLKFDDIISEDQFKGGSYTVNFFNNLGFDVEFDGVVYSSDSCLKKIN